MTRPDDLRVGDAERTRVTEALHDHFAQGRLTRDELDERIEAALSAKTFGDLRKITRDLPGAEPLAAAGPPPATAATAAGPPHAHRPHRPFLPLVAVVVLGALLLTGGPAGALLGVAKLIFFIWLVLALMAFMRIRRWRRRARRFGPPPGPWGGPWGGPWSGPGGADPFGGRRRSRRGPWDN
ncbi:MAG TPA: DUF1707 domain-containing protein [Streptosporangiaceae bacterium]